MKELTPQIIALYIGCECKMLHHSGWVGAKLIGIIDGSPVCQARDANGIDLPHTSVCDSVEGVKLILRPLSSMTEDEAWELAEIYTGEKITYVRIGSGQIIFNYLEGTEVQENCFDILSVSPNSFLYLLSKSFDLFGLIESGLAVELK